MSKFQVALDSLKSNESLVEPINECEYEIDNYDIAPILANAEDVMKSLPDNCIDVIFSDSPYNRGVNSAWDAPGHEKFTEQIKTWAKMYTRVLNDNGIGVAWTDPQYVSYWIAAFKDLGLTSVEPLIWYKPDAAWRYSWDYAGEGQTDEFLNEPQSLRDTVEAAVVFRKKFVNKLGRDKLTEIAKSEGISEDSGNCWRIGKCNGEERLKNDQGTPLHPAQKPELLVAAFLLARQDLDEVLVLDPFAGLGPVSVTAAKLNRDEFPGKYKVICSDLDDKWINTIKNRLARVEKRELYEGKQRTKANHPNSGFNMAPSTASCCIIS